MTIHSAPRSSGPKQETLFLGDASLKGCSQVASAIAILVGCLVLVGWTFNITVLKSILPGIIAMRPVTALGFILASVSLWLQLSSKKRDQAIHASWKRLIGLGSSMLVFLLGGLKLVEYFSGWTLHIEQPLFTQTATPNSFGTVAPERMAFSTALSFFLLGLSLVLLKARERKIQRLAQGLTLIPALLGFVTLIGYAYNVTEFTGVAFKLSTMALNTAVTFVVLSMGILLAFPDRTLIQPILANTVGGVTARLLLPATVVVPFVLGWLRLKGQKAGLYGTEFGVALLVLSNVIIFAVLIWRNARVLNHMDKERQQVEEVLRLNDRAMAATSSGIVISDPSKPENPIIYCNPAFERLIGYSKDEILGRNCRFIQGPDTDSAVREQIRHALREARECRVILKNYRKDGTHFWNDLAISPVQDVSGQLTHFIGVQTDITERKQAEKALLRARVAEVAKQELEKEITERKQAEESLRENEERYRFLANAMPQIVWTARPDGHLDYYNQRWYDYTGMTLEQTEGWGCEHVLHPDDLQLCIDRWTQAYQTGEHYEVEYRFKRASDGTYRWHLGRALPMKSEEGEIVQWFGTCTDINDQKQVEEEIRSALETEKELSELKSRFVSMTSHEFRTPLATILSSAELLEHYSHKWAEDRKLLHLQRIQTAVKSMVHLLEDVLLIGKAEAGKLEFNPTSLDLEQFCRDLVEEMQIGTTYSTNANSSFTLTITFGSQGECRGACMDQKLLRHILSNLLSNAIKYSPQGGTVHFNLLCERGEAVFQVRDQGIGIPAEDQAHLFDSFHRASNVSTISGTGLGLAIAKKSVELHGGRITVESEVGVGTTFRATIPLNR